MTSPLRVLIGCAPGPDRWKIRSKTFAGMAEAWADQWGGWAQERVAA